VNDRLQHRWNGTRGLLLGTIERGRADGSITCRLQADLLADSLMTLMSGLRVSARAGLDLERQRALVDLHLRACHPP
jgi:hypothetical protein